MSDNRLNEEELKKLQERLELEREKSIVIASINSDPLALKEDAHAIHVSVIGDASAGKTSLL